MRNVWLWTDLPWTRLHSAPAEQGIGTSHASASIAHSTATGVILPALTHHTTHHANKLEFEKLARAYLRLAKQAERNSQTDIVYETLRETRRHRA